MQSTPETKRKLAISVVIPTLHRPREIKDLLSTLLNQHYPASEITIIDDSRERSTFDLVMELIPQFQSIGTKLVYLRGDGSGNTSARNMGIKVSTGDAVLFLDDDTLLERNVIKGIAEFLQENSLALGVQPRIPGFADYWARSDWGTRLENRVNQVAMITYHESNRLSVRRSGAAVFPANLTKVISVQRMMGCCFCLRRSVLSELSFDTNLKKWGSYDDLDLTYRVYKKYPGTIFAIPGVSIVHTHSNLSRMSPRPLNKMTTIYWFYIFFKDLSDESILNTFALIWAMIGFVTWTVMAAFVNRDGSRFRVTRYLIRDYAESLWHLRSIRRGNLEFFNRTLN